MAEIYQSDLSKIDFNVTLRPLDNATYVQIGNNFNYRGIWLGIFGLGNMNPASGTLGMTYGPTCNFSGFKDDAYTQFVTQVVSEIDPAKQRPLYSQLNDITWTRHLRCPSYRTRSAR